MKNSLLIITILALLACSHAQTNYITFNVSPVLVTRANFYLNILRTQVQTYNWVYCNKAQLYNSVVNALIWLKQIRNSLPTGNSIDGEDNRVEGINNIVIGSNNNLKGINNWVFVSNYKGKNVNAVEDSILAIGNYKIDLTKLTSILTDPSEAIEKIDSSAYDKLVSKNAAVSFFFK